VFFRFWVSFLQCFPNTLCFREQHSKRVYLFRPLIDYRQGPWAQKEEPIANDVSGLVSFRPEVELVSYDLQRFNAA
jgi:hypothetical protein